MRDADLRLALQACSSRTRTAIVALESLQELLLTLWYQAGLSMADLEMIMGRLDQVICTLRSEVRR
jgi:hypothetical protein